MGPHLSKQVAAGRDVVTKENMTHIEHQTRHVYVKEGWSLFKYDNIAAATSGATGIGIVGEVLLLAICVVVGIWSVQKALACRVKHRSYKAYYTATSARSLEEGGGTGKVALTYQRPQRDETIERYGPPDPNRTRAKTPRTTADIHIDPAL
jgi:hypothetical protein